MTPDELDAMRRRAQLIARHVRLGPDPDNTDAIEAAAAVMTFAMGDVPRLIDRVDDLQRRNTRLATQRDRALRLLKLARDQNAVLADLLTDALGARPAPDARP